MKIRNGFVSNSSSSSFIVSFDKKPSSAEELREILFGDKEYIEHRYDLFDKLDGIYISNH